MILHDRVTIQLTVNGGELDEYGDPITTTTTYPNVPAEVHPLDTQAVLTESRDAVISRYRIVLAPVVDIPPNIGDALRISWGPFTIDPNYPMTGLFVDGTVERHYLRGRLHHYELISKSVV
ncbi:hypothetical protein FOS14_06415 [Skermania sp. ID1734]|uniref:hypothetical protein n=1 Tax=Skermania sp. ID1734 TaxID=2597516 RepID=UPI00117E9F52|nr:hypothetical protein [Skermania sp. ID1734]TSE00660.1 hypothetical protein FOS14_06415 [Skermania sp. ID1734]